MVTMTMTMTMTMMTYYIEHSSVHGGYFQEGVDDRDGRKW